MSLRIEKLTEELLAQYLKDVRQLPNEASKSARFLMLVGALFPGTNIASKLAPGIEKAIAIHLPERLKHGSMDSYFGNAIIEFENSLKATGEHAKEQLREYCAGQWAKEGKPYRPLLAISSDGISWNSFRPTLAKDPKGKPTPDDVTLEPLPSFVVREDNLADFWIWLNGLLFRQGEIIPSAEQFQQDFGRQSAACKDAIEKLKSAWLGVREHTQLRVAFENWAKYLKFTYGTLTEAPSEDPDFTQTEELFLKHTYLASVAKLMIWASLSHGKASGTYSEVVDEVFSGRFFMAKNLANLVEEDFFQWTKWTKTRDVLTPVWERIVAQIETYDLRTLSQDVLKGVYQELVDPEDRHYLGEYYTPDWLCERIVRELLPAEGYVKVLDPSCGSGSFLRAAIHHLLDHNDPGAPEQRLNLVLENVVGIDVHPLAVTIAKATYVLALGGLVKAAKRPIQIPVYMADSLFLPTEVRQIRLGGTFSFELRFGDKKISVPDTLIHAPDLFDGAIASCAFVALDHAARKSETAASLGRYLLRAIPKIAEYSDRELIIEALWLFTDGLADLIRQKKNSIWSYIIRNSYRPAMLKERFDVIVGNPPWLSYRYIELPEYQAEIKKRAVEEYRIAPKHQKLFTQMELATVFLAHSMGWFAKPGATLGFVMPRSVLSADQHMNFRNRSYSWRCKFRLTSYWDLRGVKNLFNVPSCVLFTVNTDEFGAATDPVPAKEWTGKLRRRDCHWAEAEPQLTVEEATARLIYLGKRTSLSTEAGKSKATISSSYAGRFRQGATILPRAFYFVRSKDLALPIEEEKLYWIETDPETEKKKPYEDIHLSGQSEGRFFFYTALSKHVLPFVVIRPSLTVLPLIASGGQIEVVTGDELRKRGYREFSTWVREAESIWKTKRGKKAERQTLYQWLDYQSKLTGQSLGSPYLLLYNAAGTNVSAASFARAEFDLPFLVEHKLYWASFPTRKEADYLAAILNSSAANEAIKPFQSLGLMGERDIEKKLLDLPIPKFNSDIEAHGELAGLGREARKQGAALVRSADFPDNLVKQREFIRRGLTETLKNINRIVKTLL